MAGAAGDHVAQVYIPATPTTRRTLKPRSAGARHRLVPHYRNPSSIDPNIGRLSGELAPFFTPRQHCGRTFNQRAALQQHPDVETPVGFDEAIERKVGRVVIVAQAKTANHGSETKAQWGCRTRPNGQPCAAPAPAYTANTHLRDALELDLDVLWGTLAGRAWEHPVQSSCAPAATAPFACPLRHICLQLLPPSTIFVTEAKYRYTQTSRRCKIEA